MCVCVCVYNLLMWFLAVIYQTLNLTLLFKSSKHDVKSARSLWYLCFWFRLDNLVPENSVSDDLLLENLSLDNLESDNLILGILVLANLIQDNFVPENSVLTKLVRDNSLLDRHTLFSFLEVDYINMRERLWWYNG